MSIERTPATELTQAARVNSVLWRPCESLEHARERFAQWRDWHRAPWPYQADESDEERVHDLIGAAWPCDERWEFPEVWHPTLDRLGGRALEVGRGSRGCNDADAKLGRLAWCLTRHLRPQRVVETGVGRGFTTSVLLEALERNGAGHLWSIDLRPTVERGRQTEVGVVVPERLRGRWTLLRGSSRRRLPGLLAELGGVDLFLHDSLHTSRNMRFELEQAWAGLGARAAALVDDVHLNHATGRFLQDHQEASAVLSAADDGKVLIGCLARR
ncbi:MAG: class I SAM-dependent methyltransferase [Candidatus Dormibacteraeota bacterium]|nr:class I SAM-dependent methyltransferase [Candidatus Dormibacteraeota bacterium]